MNDAFAAEAGAMAPGDALMQLRLGREQRMFETRNEAKGIDPTLVGQLITGNWSGAFRSFRSM
jgi:hypothetical protein